MNDSFKPGVYVTQPSMALALALPDAQTYVGRPATRELVEEARAAVAMLRRLAKDRQEYVIEYDDLAGAPVKAYYGVSGQALKNAHDIRQLFNYYLGAPFHGSQLGLPIE